MMRIVALFVLCVPLAALKTTDSDALEIDLEADQQATSSDDLGLTVEEEQDSTSGDALGLGLEAEQYAHPVMKVVNLLKDMKKQLQVDLDNDKNVHVKMDCWCDTNEKEKKKAIENGGIEIDRLKAKIGQLTGSLAEMKVKRKDTKTELASDEKALATAIELRKKEQAAFAKDEKDTTAAIKSLKSAIGTLKKHNTGLLEIRAVASTLKQAGVSELDSVDNLQRAAIKAFIQDAEGATSFLAIPGYKSYSSQSGQIFGILNQMQEDMETHLATIKKGEKTALKNFAALKLAKEGEITGGKKAVIDLDKRLGAAGMAKAVAQKGLKDETEQLANNQAFLANLLKQCTEHDKEYATRMKDRIEELSAVETAISTLDNEKMLKHFRKFYSKSKKLSFLQLSSTEAQQEQMRRQSAAATLERAAAHTDSPVLAMLAASVQIDAFTAVKKAISGMVKELTKQQADEVTHNNWCIKEFAENVKDTAAATDKKTTLATKKADLEKTIQTLNTQMKNAQSEVAEMKKQMSRSSDTREAANADYQQTIADQRMTQMVLKKALTTLKQVYALMQDEAPVKKSPVAPVKFKKYAKNGGGNKVVALIEGIIKDTAKAEADAIQAEQNAQTTYENFMLNSNKAIEKKSQMIMTLTGNRAKSLEELNMANKDLSSTNKKLSNLKAEDTSLHGSCDFVLKNFKVRQAARKAETDALKEAMIIMTVGAGPAPAPAIAGGAPAAVTVASPAAR